MSCNVPVISDKTMEGKENPKKSNNKKKKAMYHTEE